MLKTLCVKELVVSLCNMAFIQGRQPHFGDFIGKDIDVDLYLAVYELISFEPCLVAV